MRNIISMRQMGIAGTSRASVPAAPPRNVSVRSRKAGERAMSLLRRLYGKLHLKINESRSAVSSAFGRKFLDYARWMAPKGEVKRALARKAVEAFKQQIRWHTRGSGGRSMSKVIEKLRHYIFGWKACFGLAHTPRVWREQRV